MIKNSLQSIRFGHNRRCSRFEALESRYLLAGDVVISEFLAANQTGLRDEDGDSSDWIELHNATSAPVNLAGYYLTDKSAELNQWQFPSVTLPADGYLIVFASGKDRRVAGSNLHTNFKLDADGEYLALVKPDLSVEHEYASEFPAQQVDISYGIGPATTVLVEPGDAARFHVPTSAVLGDDWQNPIFDDSQWTAVTTGVGFQSLNNTVAGSPVGYWTFDDSTADSTGNNHPATLTGSGIAYSADVPSALNSRKSLSLPGGPSPRYAQITPFDVSEAAMTVSMWFKTSVPGHGLFSVGQGNLGLFGHDRDLYFEGTNIAAGLKGSDTTEKIVSSGRNYADGAWHHLVYVYSAGSVSQRIYIDGDPTPVAHGTASSSVASVQDRILLGFSASATGSVNDPWQGQIDDVAVWNMALSPAHIAQLFSGVSPNDLRSLASDIAAGVGTAMQNVGATSYLRIPFDVKNVSDFDSLLLQMKYDDGFVAYLNGEEIARRNAPNVVAWNSQATATNPNGKAVHFEAIDVSPHLSSLSSGRNVLAIQGLNLSLSNGDFLISPRLVDEDFLPGIEQYFDLPTPGQPAASEAIDPPDFSTQSSIFTDVMEIELSTKTSNGEIRYTMDGTMPTEASLLYAGPVTIHNSTQLRARVYKDGLAPSRVVSHFYTRAAQEVRDFSSDLPILVMNTYGRQFNGETLIPVTTHVLQDSGNRTQLSREPALALRGGLRFRGNGSEGFPKHQYAFETWDETNDDSNVEIFGMPPDSDWVIYGPYWERVLINHSLIFELANRLGQYAVRTEFVEMFINFDQVLTSSDYAGLYIFMERIKRGDNRVDVDQLEPTDNEGIDVTGGYIFAKDAHALTEEESFSTQRNQFEFVYPEGPEVTAAQRQYIAGYMNDFENTLYGPNFADPVIGYAAYIDIQSFIDHHLVVELAKDTDSFWNSTYYHKDRGGKLRAGPEWDYNNALGNLHSLTAWEPAGWWTDVVPEHYTMVYARRLLQDAEYQQRFIDSYYAYRHAQWSTESLLNTIESQVSEIYEATFREFARWPTLGTYNGVSPYYGNGQPPSYGSSSTHPNHPPRTYRDEVQLLRQWLHDRLLWMDSQFVAKPTLSLAPGNVAAGTQVTLSGPANTTIYYTLDGTDPRLPGGGIKPGALSGAGPITFNANTKVFARAKNNAVTADLKDDWSAPTIGVYVVDAPDLILSEIMYNPAAPAVGSPYTQDDFEFVEVTNVGTTPLNLNGYKFTKGISATLGNVTLNAGQSGMIVKNATAFATRYPGITPLGTFIGVLDNGGEDLTLEDNIGVKLFDGDYEDDWEPHTDGDGFSLVTTYQSSGGGTLYNTGDASDKWRASQQSGGNPAAADTGAQKNSIVINETSSNGADFIELHNTSNAPINVGGWYVSDDSTNLTKYQITAGTTIAAGGFLLLTEASHFGGAFGLSELGETVFVSSSGTGGQPGGYRISEDFGAADPGVTTGRYIKSTGRKDFVHLVSATPGAANAAPVINAVAITEIMYHPQEHVLWLNPLTGNQLRDEFIEIQNTSGAAVNISGWQLTDGVTFTFPAGQSLAAGERALIVPIAAETFRTKYTLPAGLKIYGPYSGNLDDGGEQLELGRPGTPVGGETPLIRVDRVTYDDDAPWSKFADGTGSSLSRVNVSAYGNDVANWQASHKGGTPGATNTFIDLTPPAKVAVVVAHKTGIGTTDPRTHVSWSVASDAESGTAYYKIYRRGSSTVAPLATSFLVGAAETLSFVDNTVMQGQLFQYAIAAVNADGIEGTLSEFVGPDTRVVGRHVFYNQSKLDGNDVGAGPADDAAIATDKTALLPGQTSSLANYTSYNRGLNGIMVDIGALPAGSLSASDFDFKVGNTDTPSAWSPLAASPTVSVRPAPGLSGTSRVTLVWPTGAAIKQWLQVTVKANPITGLASPDVFYFGNAVGESGNVLGDYGVSITDELLARNNPVSINPGTTVTNRFDYNRDGTVSVVDQLLARNNITTAATRLRQLIVPSNVSRIRLFLQRLDEAVSDLAIWVAQTRMPEAKRSIAQAAEEGLRPLDQRNYRHAQATAPDSPAAAEYQTSPRRRDAEVDDDLLELIFAAR